MSPTHYDRPESPLAALVDAERNRSEGTISTKITLSNAPATAVVRLYGAHITSAYVKCPDTYQVQELLYPGNDQWDKPKKSPKFRASHFGAPAGPDGFGVGNKHGAARYITFEVLDNHPTMVNLKASLGDLALYRDVLLSQESLTIIDELRNNREEDSEFTSMLNHLYLNRGIIPVTPDNPVTINGNTMDDILGIDGAGERVINGEPFYWPGFSDLDSATVGMPDGSQINVAASIDGDNVGGALLWAPEGENAFCLEPVAGYSARSNRGQIIPAGDSATLIVSLSSRLPRI